MREGGEKAAMIRMYNVLVKMVSKRYKSRQKLEKLRQVNKELKNYERG